MTKSSRETHAPDILESAHPMPRQVNPSLGRIELGSETVECDTQGSDTGMVDWFNIVPDDAISYSKSSECNIPVERLGHLAPVATDSGRLHSFVVFGSSTQSICVFKRRTKVFEYGDKKLLRKFLYRQ